MRLSRDLRVNRRHAGVDTTLWWEYQPGDRVMTREGVPGVVTEISDGPFAGNEEYIVVLDAGLGGGRYSSSELSRIGETPGRTAAWSSPAMRVFDGTDINRLRTHSIVDGVAACNPALKALFAEGDNGEIDCKACLRMSTTAGRLTLPQQGLPEAGVEAAIGGELRVAAEDYPELGDILDRRPDHQISVRGMRSAWKGNMLCGICGKVQSIDGEGGPCSSCSTSKVAEVIEVPASDPTAGEREVAELIEKGNYTHVGLAIKAVDSGRVLLVQRTPYEGDTEGVYGRWEFPGGGIDEGEDALGGALREFREETGLQLPEKFRLVGGMPSGTYLLIMALVPHEGWTTDAQLLDFEVMGLGWFHPDQIENADDLVREEMDDTEWDMVREAMRRVAAEGGDVDAKSWRKGDIVIDSNGDRWRLTYSYGSSTAENIYVAREGDDGPYPRSNRSVRVYTDGTARYLRDGEPLRKTAGYDDPDYYRNTGLYDEDFETPRSGWEQPTTTETPCYSCVGGFAEDGSICTYCHGSGTVLGSLVSIRTEAFSGLDLIPDKLLDWAADKEGVEPGHNWSYDFCRFRRDSRCYYPKHLDEVATKQAGYAVWSPEDRGFCPRQQWDEQKSCPVAEPGPHSKDPQALPDATRSWADGGQRQGALDADAVLAGVSDGGEFGFHITAAWRDVQTKAKRIRSEGGVRIIASSGSSVTGEVRGDTAIYQTSIMRFGKSVATWECGCKWGAYSWGRSGRWTKFEGRMCAHALALTYQAQAEEMFGGKIEEQAEAPAWRNDPTQTVKVPGDQKVTDRPWRVGLLAAHGMRWVETDPALHAPPAISIAAALLEDGSTPVEAAESLSQWAGTTSINTMAFVVQALQGFPFRARIRGVIETILGVLPNGFFDTSAGAVQGSDILHPTYDDSLGLSLRDSMGALHEAARQTYTIIGPLGGAAGTSSDWELHIAGCGDLSQPKYRDFLRGSHDIQADSAQEAAESWVDEEMREMGYSVAEHVKVFPCAKRGIPAAPPAPKVVDPSVCPGTGMPFAPGTDMRRLYLPCPECGASVGTGRGVVPRHKKKPDFLYGEISVGQWPNDKTEKHISGQDQMALCGAGRVSYPKPMKSDPVRGMCTTCVDLWRQPTTGSYLASDSRFEGVGLKQDDDGWYVSTHRARSDSYPTPDDIPTATVSFIESTGIYVDPKADEQKAKARSTSQDDAGATSESAPASATSPSAAPAAAPAVTAEYHHFDQDKTPGPAWDGARGAEDDHQAVVDGMITTHRGPKDECPLCSTKEGIFLDQTCSEALFEQGDGVFGDTGFEEDAVSWYAPTDAGQSIAQEQTGHPDVQWSMHVSDLHDEPEPALPETDGDVAGFLAEHPRWAMEETMAAHGVDLEAIPSEALPGHPMLAHLMGGIPDPQTSGTPAMASDSDIADRARQVLAGKVFTQAERAQIIGEGGADVRAGNLDLLDIAGTHYEAIEAALNSSDPSDDGALFG